MDRRHLSSQSCLEESGYETEESSFSLNRVGDSLRFRGEENQAKENGQDDEETETDEDGRDEGEEDGREGGGEEVGSNASLVGMRTESSFRRLLPYRRVSVEKALGLLMESLDEQSPSLGLRRLVRETLWEDVNRRTRRSLRAWEEDEREEETCGYELDGDGGSRRWLRRSMAGDDVEAWKASGEIFPIGSRHAWTTLSTLSLSSTPASESGVSTTTSEMDNLDSRSHVHHLPSSVELDSTTLTSLRRTSKLPVRKEKGGERFFSRRASDSTIPLKASVQVVIPSPHSYQSKRKKGSRRSDIALPHSQSSSKDPSSASHPARKSNTKRKKKKNTSVRKAIYSVIFPTNEPEEKRKFFADMTYNPQFEYSNPRRALETKLLYSDVSFEFFYEARGILHHVLEEFGSESSFLEASGGPLLSIEQSISVFDAWLQLHNMDCQVSLISNSASPTSIKNGILFIRVPVEYRRNTIVGVANHEIGTHLLRRLNNMQQPWAQVGAKKDDFGLQTKIIETEEGLACINTILFSPSPYLYKAALHYYSVCMASRLSFTDLFEDLKHFIDDPDRCWSECLRVKRGLEDTSQSDSFSKDQAYFSGAMNILRCRKEIDFHLLWSGKIHLDDLEKIKGLACLDSIVLPFFAHDAQDYLARLDRVALYNGIESSSS